MQWKFGCVFAFAEIKVIVVILKDFLRKHKLFTQYI